MNTPKKKSNVLADTGCCWGPIVFGLCLLLVFTYFVDGFFKPSETAQGIGPWLMKNAGSFLIGTLVLVGLLVFAAVLDKVGNKLSNVLNLGPLGDTNMCPRCHKPSALDEVSATALSTSFGVDPYHRSFGTSTTKSRVTMQCRYCGHTVTRTKTERQKG